MTMFASHLLSGSVRSGFLHGISLARCRFAVLYGSSLSCCCFSICSYFGLCHVMPFHVPNATPCIYVEIIAALMFFIRKNMSHHEAAQNRPGVGMRTKTSTNHPWNVNASQLPGPLIHRPSGQFALRWMWSVIRSHGCQNECGMCVCHLDTVVKQASGYQQNSKCLHGCQQGGTCVKQMWKSCMVCIASEEIGTLNVTIIHSR